MDENCIEFEIHTYQNFYVDLRQIFLALGLILPKGRGYKTYKNEEAKKAKVQIKREFRGGHDRGGIRGNSSSSSGYSYRQHSTFFFSNV